MSDTNHPSPGGTGRAFASMSAQGMQQLVHHMGEAVTALTSDFSLIRARVRSTNVPTQALAQIDEIASWAEIQIPYLERRRNLAIGLTDGQSPTAFVDVPEPLPTGLQTPAGAEAYGRRLANDLIDAIDLHNSDGAVPDNFVHEFLDNFEPYLNDPDVMAGFFIELGPERLENLPTIILPQMINQWTHDSVLIARFTELLSRGLAAALNTHDGYSSTADYYSELAELRHHFQQPTDDPRVAWSRLALLQYGDFNSTFVADVIHGSVLHHLRDATSGELAPVGTDRFAIGSSTSFPSGLPAALELPGNVFELAFNMLAADPLAARRALHRENSATVDEYISAMHLAEEAAEQVPPAVHNAFARALAAGAGALDNPPDDGQQAADFAFATILGLNEHELRSEVMAHAMAEPLDMIAAAYAEELLLGAQIQDGAPREPSMQRPDGFDIPFDGMEPRFYLSQQDVYRFLFRLGADNSHSTNFDMAVEALADQLLPDVIAADMAAMESGETNGARNLKSAIRMFGALAGLQYEGRFRLRNQLDIDEAERRTEDMFCISA